MFGSVPDVLTLEMPPLLPWQEEVDKLPYRFIVIPGGRRVGKTTWGAQKCFFSAMQQQDEIWWVAPTYGVSRLGFDMMLALAEQMPKSLYEISRGDRSISFWNGGKVVSKSANNPHNLRGTGLGGLVIDEAAYVHRKTWYDVLRPTLSDKRGWAILISTPNGDSNWFYDISRLQEKRKNWITRCVPTSENPFILPEEIEDARASLPEVVFDIEYLAVFRAYEGMYFTNVDAIATATEQIQGVPGGRYCVGIDLAEVSDYTVFAVSDVIKRELVYVERFNKIAWIEQVNRLKDLWRRFKFQDAIIEINFNRSFADFVRQTIPGLNVIEFTTTNVSKREIADNLRIAFSTGRYTVINDPQLIRELKAFRIEKLDSGRIRLAATPGEHDDEVIATLLSYYGVENPNHPGWQARVA